MLSYCHGGQLSIANVSPARTSSALWLPLIEWEWEGKRMPHSTAVEPAVGLQQTVSCQIQWSFSLVFWEEEWLVGGDPFYQKFWVNRPRWSKFADFQPIFARNSSAVTPSEKSSINTNRKSTTCFPMSLRWSSYVAPKSPKGVSKTQNGRFPCEIAHRLKKVCYKVCLCENCQRLSCKAFIGLTNRAKMIGGGDPLYWKFWIKVTALERNRRFSIYFRS